MKNILLALAALIPCVLNAQHRPERNEYMRSVYWGGTEIRLQGHLQALGGIEDPFAGLGAGLESPVSWRISLSFDANFGLNHNRTSQEYRPAVLYYFGRHQLGFFAGPALKYIHIRERDGQHNRGHQYGAGIDFGVKTTLLDFITFSFRGSPHVNISSGYGEQNSGLSAQLGLGLRL